MLQSIRSITDLWRDRHVAETLAIAQNGGRVNTAASPGLWRTTTRNGPIALSGLQTPEPKLRPVTGAIRSRPVLSGLHHVYERAA
jgi:hypothetical protein